MSMEPIRTIVVDDEPDAREGILGLLRGDPEIVVVGECRTGPEAVASIEDARPDLVFLDIQMPELDGFDVVDAVGAERMPCVVFVTAHDEYALKAFETHALDYLLKPFSDARFSDALQRAKEQVRQSRVTELGHKLAALLREDSERMAGGAPQHVPNGNTPPAPQQYLDRVMIRTARQVFFVRVEEIDWIQADDYYAKLHVAGRAHLIRETMQQLEAQLDPKRFVRVHRSAIVNIDRIKSLAPYFRGGHVILLQDGTRITLSRSRRANLERALGWQL